MELEQAYAEYRSAMTAWRSASKAGSSDLVESAGNRLIGARVALYRTLLATGWVPPTQVAVQLDRDIALVEVPDDLEPLLLP